MTVQAVDGAAGCGKTTRLMEMLEETLAVHPLQEGQRVLALTYYHGGRRRLLERVRHAPALAGHVECRTVDGFALRLVRRWRGLATALGIPVIGDDEYLAICSAAGTLLEHPQVQAWATLSFPIVILDEGQDLDPERLRIFSAMANSATILIAADEFQCLDTDLRPNPLVGWLADAAQTETLIHVHRTDVAGLLNAATAIRNGQAPINSGQQFTVAVTPSVPFAATFLSNAIGWHPGTTDVALISPSPSAPWVRDLVERSRTQASNQGNGPYDIRWEANDADETSKIVEALQMGLVESAATTIAALRQLPESGPARQSVTWVRKQVDVTGREEFRRNEVEAAISRFVTLRRQHGGNSTHRYTAMTVHQAKNREFDGVIVLWPYQVVGDAEQKRRLLYNAVTRAKHWCTVLVQSEEIQSAAPFSNLQ